MTSGCPAAMHAVGTISPVHYFSTMLSRDMIKEAQQCEVHAARCIAKDGRLFLLHSAQQWREMAEAMDLLEQQGVRRIIQRRTLIAFSGKPKP